MSLTIWVEGSVESECPAAWVARVAQIYLQSVRPIGDCWTNWTTDVEVHLAIGCAMTEECEKMHWLAEAISIQLAYHGIRYCYW